MSKNTKIIISLVVLIALLMGGLLIFTQPAAPEGKCIITVSNSQYDVTTLKNSHSGGNVFECGTDMTELFESQHGGDISRIEEYKID